MRKLNTAAGGKNGKNPIYAIAQDITPNRTFNNTGDKEVI